MKKDIFINFCLRQHPDIGGTYTAQSLFRKFSNSYFIDIEIPGFKSRSEADFTIPGSINPFISFLKAADSNFFSFIPESVRTKTQGIIIHSGFLSHFSYGYQLSRQLNVPLYLVPHGFSDPYAFSYNKLKKKIWLELIGKVVAKYASKIIYSSEAEKNKSILPTSQSKGYICNWAFENPPFIERNAAKKSLREKLGLSDEDKILLFFSRIEKMKRPLETMHSFIKVQPKRWKFLMMGPFEDTVLQDELESLQKSNKNIFLHPPVFGKDKWQFIAGSDAYILLSHRENFGFTVVEAASLGLPVYISKGVDIYPYFNFEEQKTVFDISNPGDIDEVMMSLNNITKEEISKLGYLCQNTVINNFGFRKFSETLNNILEL
jgi:glycosyltransferase involved in cell wall biosynthesis